MSKELYGKNILFLSVGFYEYDSKIINTINAMGANVTYFTDQPTILRNILFYRISNIFPILVHLFRRSYLHKVHAKIKKLKFDYVFVIKGEFLQEWFLKELRITYNQAKFILYQWDSIKNVANFPIIKKYFDSILTFDWEDFCNNPSFKFRPLFYVTSSVKPAITSYDLVFIGKLHPNRIEILSYFLYFLQKNNLTYKLYLKTGIKLWLKLILKRSPLAEFTHLKSLPYNKVNYYINKAKVILDIHSFTQSGLTMRTIEALGAQKKLITTNQDIKNYDFYTTENTILISNNNLTHLNKEFFNISYKPLPLATYTNYSIKTWLLDIFNSVNNTTLIEAKFHA